MIPQVRAELLKVRSTRTTLGLVVGMLLLALLIVLLSGLLTHPDGLASEEDQLNLVATGGVALIFSALAGVLLVTSEYRYGTIHPTLLFTPPVALAVAVSFAVLGFAGLLPQPRGRKVLLGGFFSAAARLTAAIFVLVAFPYQLADRLDLAVFHLL